MRSVKTTYRAPALVWLSIGTAAFAALGLAACVGEGTSLPSGGADSGGSETEADAGNPATDGGDGGEGSTDGSTREDGSFEEDPPSPDPVLVPLGGGRSQLTSLTFDAAGNIYAAGLASSGTDQATVIAKFRPNGALDTAFGTGGFTILNVVAAGTRERLYGVAVLPDGKVLAAGIAEKPSSTTDMNATLIRLLPNGAPDASFGSNGVRVSSLARSCTLTSGFEADQIAGISVAGGKAYLYGSHCSNNLRQIFATRLNDDGTSDTTYGVNGFADIPSSNAYGMYALGGTTLQDGSVVVGGRQLQGNIEIARGVIAKFDPTGKPASGFGVGSVFREAVLSSSGISQVNGVTTAGNKILAAATLSPNEDVEPTEMAAFQIGAQNGSLDLSYAAPSGYVRIREGAEYWSGAAIAALADGRQVLVGRMGGSTQMNGVIAVRLADGSADTTFAPTGTKVFDIGRSSDEDEFLAVATAPSGKRVVAVGSGTDTQRRAAIHVIDFP